MGDTDGEFLQQVGKQVAVAVDNVLHHQDLARDRDRLRLLLEVSESIASHRDLDELLRDLAQRLPHIVPIRLHQRRAARPCSPGHATVFSGDS